MNAIVLDAETIAKMLGAALLRIGVRQIVLEHAHLEILASRGGLDVTVKDGPGNGYTIDVGFADETPRPEPREESVVLDPDGACSTELAAAGRPYPRFCARCGLGPCSGAGPR